MVKKSHVSNVEDIKAALSLQKLPYNHLQYKQTALHLIDQLYGVVGGIRMNETGAAAAICYVAIGRFDAGWKLLENGIILQHRLFRKRVEQTDFLW